MARTFCLLIFPILLFCDEFIFWAQYFTKNGLITTQNVSVSKAMVKTAIANTQTFCFIDIPKLSHEEELQYLNRNIELLSDCFVTAPSKIVSLSEFSKNTAVSLKTNLTYIPIRFLLDFDEKGAIISIFEEKK